MSDRVAWVTGGSRGIGRAIVETLASGGWRVAFTYRVKEAAAREVEAATDGRARAFPLDLRDASRPLALVREVEAALGPLHALVNNAGERRPALLAFTSDGDWQDVVDANLGGAFRCCRAVVPGMVSRRTGAIVNVASLAATSGVAGEAAYAASKAGLLAMTRVLAREIGRKGVRVNAVVPGWVETDMSAATPKEAADALRAREILPGAATPASVASVVAFLLSDAARAITGQAIVVDAGTSA